MTSGEVFAVGARVYDSSEGVCTVSGHMVTGPGHTDKGRAAQEGERPTTYVLSGRGGSVYRAVADDAPVPTLRALASAEVARAMLDTLRGERFETVEALQRAKLLDARNDVARVTRPDESATILRAWYALPFEALDGELVLRAHSLERHVLGEAAEVLALSVDALRGEMRTRHAGLARWDAEADQRAEARKLALAAAKSRKKRAKPSKLP